MDFKKGALMPQKPSAPKEQDINCSAIIDGVQCGGVVKRRPRSGGKDPCVCSRCGRIYPSYTGLIRAAEPGVPKKQSKAAAKAKPSKPKIKRVESPRTQHNLPQHDGIETLELETVYEAAPEIHPVDDLADLWTGKPDSFGLTLADVQKVLSAEAARLVASKFILGGIDFNPSHLPEKEALAAVRAASISSLMFIGKTSTQSEVDDTRKGEEARAAAQAAKSELVRSEHAQYRLSFSFASGEMTEEQTKEFCSVDLIPKNLVKSAPPSPERLFKIVTAEQLSKSLSSKITNNFTQETVTEYVDFWRSVCSAICNDEFGGNSYWIAAGGNWSIGAYAAEVIKTAFAAGLSVTPMASLEQLCAVFERSHNYLNDLEFIHNAPRNMRDTLEQFSMFNQAYRAIYEGGIAAYKPKPVPPYRFTWRAYTESDLVIVTLPSVGLVTGGAAVLTELLTARSIAGLATIVVSTRSLVELNELNAGFIPEVFSKAGISLISRKDTRTAEDTGTHNFIYFSVHGDAPERGSAVQRKTRRIEKRQ